MAAQVAAEIVTLAIFVGAYVLFALRESWRTWTAAGAAGLGLAVAALAGDLPLSSSGACQLFAYRPAGSPWGLTGCAAPGYVEWDTLGLLLGLMLLAALLNSLGVFTWAAIKIARFARGSPVWLFLLLSLLTFALSAFINSITVMVVMATITLEIARALGRDPIPLLLVEISASNAGGAATFVGDPPNVILGTYFGLGFNSFIEEAAPMAIAALVVTLVLFWFVSRKALAKTSTPEAQPSTLPPLPTLNGPKTAAAVGAFAVTLALLIVNDLIPPSVGEIGLIGAALALLVAGRDGAAPLVKAVDWNTLTFFLFLFLLVGSLEATGIIGSLAGGLGALGGTNAFLMASLLLWVLGLLSSVIDNVPLAAAAAPLIQSLHQTRGLPVSTLIFATAVGTDVGGNGTPIGASANVVGLAVAQRAGVAVSWRTYVTRAFPIMLASLAAANAVLWFLIH